MMTRFSLIDEITIGFGVRHRISDGAWERANVGPRRRRQGRAAAAALGDHPPDQDILLAAEPGARTAGVPVLGRTVAADHLDDLTAAGGRR